MTYCAAAAVSAGIVFASDSRTNAGVDHVATYTKMTVFEVPGDRVLVLLAAGNLATTQSVVGLLRSRAAEGIHAKTNLFDVATIVGETLREVVSRDGPALEQAKIEPGCNFILGGQVRGEAPRLFQIYPQGNFIETSRETPYLQIGETKYGKPIIDRVVNSDTSLKDAAKCLLVSFDSTMRSNLSVGLPIDLLAYEKDSLKITLRRRIVEGDEYFRELSRLWSSGLRRVFTEVPDLSWQ
jgi:putative proteasome-type protease